ncbi:unnamed protein product, partial [Chrysoparadoxa australica]
MSSNSMLKGVGSIGVGLVVGSGAAAVLNKRDGEAAAQDVVNGVVRFSRALSYGALAAADYKISLRGEEVGSKQYWAKKKE